VQIGANDIVRFKSIDDAADELTLALEKLPHAERVIVISAGNVGGTKFFPFFVNPIYTQLNLGYHDSFEVVVKNAGGVYVNLYEDPSTDPFVQEPEKYLARDGFHPTSAGYKLWFEKIIEKVSI
jgi:lysophospholipase L1-like esterase